MDEKSKILITGSTGMIGSALVHSLKLQGFTKLLTPKQADLDLRDPHATAQYFSRHKPEYVFHLAARVGGIHANSIYPGQFIYDNTAMQCSVFEAARKVKVKKILFPGSACTYPKMAPQPVKESEFLNGLIEPTNIAYAAAKINGIVMAQSYAREYGLRIVLPMPTNTYGVGDNFDPEAAHVIPALMQRLHAAKLYNSQEVIVWGSGRPLREFIYVNDVADAFIFLMQNYNSHDIVNVGSMQDITIANLATAIAKVVGYKGTISLDKTKPDGAPRKMLDSSKLFALGWKPQIGLEDGLGRMYKKHFMGKV